ncbi:DNA polymerase III subunit delta [Pseudaquabacterium rugosum]|jgi:DNA polymerase-3 subunit delta|uniref:DNA polymerase III subunit delta n=1 Tax=Pseudaquabacterium rugosum TaxID=2984194 RepID=A0ABU9BBH6_9BURK
MQLTSDRLDAHLARGLQRIYTVHGDEPLLLQEATDAIRAAGRAAGYTERQVFVVSGAHFDWSGVLGAAQEMSLFADRQIIEIRIPSGKPGKDGGEALQRYAQLVSEDVLTIVHLPRLDRQQLQSAWFTALDGAGVSVALQPVDRGALPQWLARRLAAQGQQVAPGEAGEQTLAFFADRVEGHLLAAHQELQKLALLHPPGELSYEQVEAAVLNVARYDVTKLVEAVMMGHVPRLLRVLDGLQAEGEATVMVLWHLSDTIGALRRLRRAIDAGRPMPVAFNEARVWGPRQRQFERVLPLFDEAALARLLVAASHCDGIVKGLKQPDWPLDPWLALRRLALLLVQPMAEARLAAAAAQRGARGRGAARRLAPLALSAH